MIDVRVKQEAKKRGIMTPYRLALEVGISQSMAARLWKGEELPRLETLDRICGQWDCEIGVLVVSVREGARKKRKTERRR